MQPFPVAHLTRGRAYFPQVAGTSAPLLTPRFSSWWCTRIYGGAGVGVRILANTTDSHDQKRCVLPLEGWQSREDGRLRLGQLPAMPGGVTPRPTPPSDR